MHYKNIQTNEYVVSVSVRILPKRVDWEYKLILRKVQEKVTRTWEGPGVRTCRKTRTKQGRFCYEKITQAQFRQNKMETKENSSQRVNFDLIQTTSSHLLTFVPANPFTANSNFFKRTLFSKQNIKKEEKSFSASVKKYFFCFSYFHFFIIFLFSSSFLINVFPFSFFIRLCFHSPLLFNYFSLRWFYLSIFISLFSQPCSFFPFFLLFSLS